MFWVNMVGCGVNASSEGSKVAVEIFEICSTARREEPIAYHHYDDEIAKY